MRDFRTMTPSSRRSTAMSRCSHSILRKAGFSSTAAAFTLILRLPKYRSVLGLLSLFDIDRLSLFEKGPRVQRFGHEVLLPIVVPAKPTGRANARPMTGSARAGTQPQALVVTHDVDHLGRQKHPAVWIPAFAGTTIECGYRGGVCRYLGAMRMAPSRRMVSPFSIGFSTIWTARLPYSEASPSRAGFGTCSPRLFRASSLSPISSGVRNRPGAMVLTRIF